ncbi:conserved hypothetical protein [Cenarchaeum symbiosum A]|uniref:Uncharacterized protein n=1 Tax=Cenarchaeum symbiosum (strain A) TaxID=414004 RepID=A0RW07_CENSY|nr:conserved hypothetical protein [Cenarchaeum symbiosum A]
MQAKRENGVYFTTNNPFKLRPFKAWARKIELKNKKILEPFAGKNNIITMLKEEDLCKSFCSYDIVPKNNQVKVRDTIRDFPTGYNVCVSNPPWLANYSAKRRKIKFPDIGFENLYQYCLKLALDNCENVAYIVPGTYLRTNLFRDRLDTVIFVNSLMFNDTENPACIALFTKQNKNNTKIYHDNKLIGSLDKLREIHYSMQQQSHVKNISFNHPSGNLGLICIDSTAGPTIRFCRGDEVARSVKHSDRLITKIGGNFTNLDRTILRLNKALYRYRKNTHDVFLAPFKGLRRDGQYRRRLDYATARGIIERYA